MNKSYFSTLLNVLFCLYASFTLSAQCPNLLWADEFSGNSLDETSWNYQLGTGCDIGICGWGNNELQYYQQENVTVSNGTLQITAKKQRVRGNQYTSARINTDGKRQWTYGRMEARIKLPAGGGLWPAFWMLPNDYVYGGWPQSGEIDIMEFVGHEPDKVLGTIHYGDPYPNNQFQGGDFRLLNGQFPDAYHDFAIEWEAGEIRWFVDDILYSTKTIADIAPYNWPFDQDFHFLLNVAVGGNLGGTVDNSIFPATMEVDYVRVYDGHRPYISGSRIVANAASGVTYSIGNVSGGTQVTWTVPTGATIVSGQGSPTLTVDWGDTGGTVTADVNTACGTQSIAMEVFVEPPYIKEYSLENFDEAPTATLGTYTGAYSEVNNPAPNAVNSSSLCGRYQRNGSEQYDVLVYGVSTITNADDYVNRDKKFYVDIYTAAPIGTEILLQLETPDATPSNYPTGRHSRYVATITENNNWHRLEFNLLDRPDGGASGANINNLILLFNSNSFTSDVYHYDNLDSYGIDDGGPGGTATEMYVSSIVAGTQGAGKGQKRAQATVTILDDLGAPVANATVFGTFSGTFNESVSGTTAADGTVSLTSNGSAKGTISVTLCVDDVQHSTLTYNASLNQQTCSSNGSRMGLLPTYESSRRFQVFPNPFSSNVQLQWPADQEDGTIEVEIFAQTGSRVYQSQLTLNDGDMPSVQLSLADLPQGVYILRVHTQHKVETIRLVKQQQ